VDVQYRISERDKNGKVAAIESGSFSQITVGSSVVCRSNSAAVIGWKGRISLDCGYLTVLIAFGNSVLDIHKISSYIPEAGVGRL
jgi:hypothetical protein